MNPGYGIRTHAFQACPLNRSGTSPKTTRIPNIIYGQAVCKKNFVPAVAVCGCCDIYYVIDLGRDIDADFRTSILKDAAVAE